MISKGHIIGAWLGIAASIATVGGFWIDMRAANAKRDADAQALIVQQISQAKADQATHDQMIQWMHSLQQQIRFVAESSMTKRDKQVFAQAFMALQRQQQQQSEMTPEVHEPVLAERSMRVPYASADAPSAEKPKQEKPQ